MESVHLKVMICNKFVKAFEIKNEPMATVFLRSKKSIGQYMALVRNARFSYSLSQQIDYFIVDDISFLRGKKQHCVVIHIGVARQIESSPPLWQLSKFPSSR